MKNTRFVDDLIAQEKIQNHLGHLGMMVSGSKSIYRSNYPDNLVLFNANVCAEFIEKDSFLGIIPYNITSIRKVWWGDIDITFSRADLIQSAKDLGKTIYVLSEMDARFEHAEKPNWKKYYIKITPEGEEYIGEHVQPHVIINDEVLQLISKE